LLRTRYAKSSRPIFLLYSPQGEQVEVIEVRALAFDNPNPNLNPNPNPNPNAH